MRVAVGSDHAGLSLKRALVRELARLGHEVDDRGAFDEASVDYPDFAGAVAAEVAAGRAERGVLVCGTGIGMSIAANKHRGIRAALCGSEYEARMARAHNDANVLCLGSRVVGEGLAVSILGAFLAGAFEGGRHAQRLAKIEKAEEER
jgi:ribose 5-phosphate isomerase B